MPKPTSLSKIPNVFQLLQTSLAVYRDNFLTIAGYVTWLLIPYLGLILLDLAPADHWGVITSQLLLNFIQALLWLWIIIILVTLIRGWINKKPTSDEQVMVDAWRLIIPLAVIAFIQSLIIVGGLIFFVIPGLIFFVWYSFSQLSVILDKQRDLKALAFSRELSRGRFWLVAWQLAGGPLIFLTLFSLILGLITATLTPLFGLDPVALDLAIQAGHTPIWMSVISTLSETFIVAPILLIYVTLLYEYLKKGKVVKK
ncbi:hypothetical protein KJ611_02410 [Patescibacteria group bacterium]|nr:hypothetical protein [Patescibacteria group bacterium]MBU1705593.1 hypothetical protein [Patescibacteria group bacterium]